jgi:hypothetical protein
MGAHINPFRQDSMIHNMQTDRTLTAGVAYALTRAADMATALSCRWRTQSLEM